MRNYGLRATAGVALLWLSLAAGGAQEAYPLRAVNVEGAIHFDPERIAAATELKLGDSVTPADFEKAIGKLGAAGVFESLEFRYGPQGDGYQVTFVVTEVDRLYPVRLEGFDATDEELYALLERKITLFSPRAPPTGAMTRRIGNVLEEHWRQGGNESEVIGKIAPIEGGELALLYQPKGSTKAISFVTFTGAEALPAIELQRIFNKSAMGEAYTEARLQELLHFSIRPLYADKGRMEVSFCPCTTEPDPGSEGLLVEVAVDEGPEFHYGAVEIPVIPVLEPEKVARIFDFSPGQTVNMGAVREAQGALEEDVRRQGFLRVDSELTAPVDNENKTVDLALSFELGARYALARLHIKGLDILSEPVVRRRWAIEVGDPYNPSYPGLFLDRIRQENMFDNLADTKWREQINETNKSVEVTLEFLGRKREDSFPGASADPVKDPF